MVSYDMCVGDKTKDTLRGAVCYYRNTDDKIRSDRMYKVYIHKSVTTSYNDEEILLWLDIINEAGFPCETIGWTKIPTYSGYGGRGEPVGEREVYQVNVHDKDHYTKTHRLATLTLIRYLWEGSYKQIPEIALILNASTDWTPFEIITLSNFFAKRAINNRGGGHCIVKYADEKLQTKEEYFEHLKKDDYDDDRTHTHVHASFGFKGRNDLSREDREKVVDLFENGEFEKAKEFYL